MKLRSVWGGQSAVVGLGWLGVATLLFSSSSPLRADSIVEPFDEPSALAEWEFTTRASAEGIEVESYDIQINGGALVCSNVEPERQTPIVDLDACHVFLPRPFSAGGAFAVELTVDWRSGNRDEAMQGLLVQLSGDGFPVVSFGYWDAWVLHAGTWLFTLEGTASRGNAPSLPKDGRAVVRLERDVDGMIDAFWNDELVIEGVSREVIDRIELDFQHKPYDGEHGRAIFGRVSVLDLRAESPGSRFRRGDANADGRIDIGDALRILYWLFGPAELSCLAAADVDASEAIAIGDAIGLLSYLFLGTIPPPPPFSECGVERSPTALDCELFMPCGAA